MHGGWVVFDLDDIVSTEFFDHDVGRFFLVMHGVEGEGGSVHGRHLAQESLGGGDLVGFVGGSDLGNRLSALMIDRGHQVQGLGRFFVSAFESLTVNRKPRYQASTQILSDLGQPLSTVWWTKRGRGRKDSLRLDAWWVGCLCWMI